MGRTIKYDFAGLDFRVAAEDLAGPGLVKAFAPDLDPPLRLTVDLGFGRGELLLDLARGEPGAPLLENLHAPAASSCEPPPRSATAYELEWRALGRECRYFTYRRTRLPLLDTAAGGP